MKKYKSIYDERHGYYKLAPCLEFEIKGQKIPQKILDNIKIHDFQYCYKISYKNIIWEQLTKYIGLYHLQGDEAFNDIKPEYKEKIKEIYLQPKNETQIVALIIEELYKYTFKELRDSEYNTLITTEKPLNAW